MTFHATATTVFAHVAIALRSGGFLSNRDELVLRLDSFIKFQVTVPWRVSNGLVQRLTDQDHLQIS